MRITKVAAAAVACLVSVLSLPVGLASADLSGCVSTNGVISTPYGYYSYEIHCVLKNSSTTYPLNQVRSRITLSSGSHGTVSFYGPWVGLQTSSNICVETQANTTSACPDAIGSTYVSAGYQRR